jgi:hypothetical protein
LQDIADLYPDEGTSEKADDLGKVSIAILTGREYIDELVKRTKDVDPDDEADEGFTSFGHWHEVWPFNMRDTTALLAEDRFYAFGDSGGIGGTDDGYATREEAVQAMKDDDTDDVGTTADQLGQSVITVLSGREYIDAVYALVKGGSGDMEDYGTWSL